MGANRTPIDSSMTVQKAISQGGYYNTDGEWNSIVTLDEYPGKILRGRVETLILKDGKLFMYMKDNGTYRIPGGGFDKGVLNKDQAFIETKEEAKLIIDNLRYSGVTYTHLFDEVWTHNDKEIPYHGNHTEVYVATYKGNYEGYIKKGLSDMELTNKGKFYDLSEVEDILKEPHKQALMNVFGGVVTESSTEHHDLILTAQQLQRIIYNLHFKMNMYHCIDAVGIDYDDNGILFAHFDTTTPYEVDEVKRFIKYCNSVIKSTVYKGYVAEPDTYKYGFLYIRSEYDKRSSYISY